MIDIDLAAELTYCECFYSICGEGSEVFTPAIFVRFAGCNLSCKYPCDTPHSQDTSVGFSTTVQDLFKVVQRTNAFCKVVFISGGEPLLQPSLLHFVRLLENEGYSILLQSNGTLYRQEVFDCCDLISLDCKGPSAGVCNNSSDEVICKVIQRYSPALQIKFLVGDIDDFIFAKQKIESFSAYRKRVTFVIGPIGGISVDMLLEKVSKDPFLGSLRGCLRVGAQIHKLLWGNRRGV